MPIVKKVRKGSSSRKKVKRSSLPTVPNEPPESFLEFITLIFGRKGIGKSTLCGSLSKLEKKKNLVMMLEKGRQNLRIYQVPKRKKGEKYVPPTWEQVLEWTEEFSTSDFYDSLTIDTLDQLYKLCFAHVCDGMGYKHPDDAGKGKASGVWQEIEAEFNSYLTSLLQIGKPVIFVSHEKVREIESKKLRELKKEAKGDDEDGDESKIERIEPSCSPAALRAVQEMCDYVLYIGYHNRKRAVTVRDTGDYIWVSCGVPDTFLDPDGNEINQFFLGDTPEEARKNLIRAFNNELRDVDYEPPRKKKKRRAV